MEEELPDGFRRCLLGDVVNLKRGYDLPYRDRREGNIPIVSSSGITGFHNLAKVKAPGVVTGRYGTIGEVFYLEEDFWPLNTTLYVTDFKANQPRFVAYFLRTLGLGGQNTAGAVPGVNRNVLHKLEVIIPEPRFHERISDILGAYDDLIANNERRIGLLEEAMHLLYREWFVHLRFPGWEETAVVDGVPEGWEKIKINDAFDILGGGTPSKKKQEFWTDGDINWYTPTDLTKTGLMFKEKSILQINGLGLSKSSARIFPPYSVMMTSRATIGAISINTTEACTNQGFITCIPNDQMPLYFLYCWLLTNVPRFINFASGATFKEISKGVFKKLPIIRPDIQLVNTFQETVDPMAKQILNLQRQNEKLKEARDALLPRLMSGRIEV